MIRRNTVRKQKELERQYGKKPCAHSHDHGDHHHDHDHPCGGIKDFDEFKGFLKDVTPVVDWLNPDDIDTSKL